jgi:hypothetical protein
VTSYEEHREQIANGTISVWRRPEGLWGVSWTPFEGLAGHVTGGAEYTSKTRPRPAGFPRKYDVAEAMSWARARWGARAIES